VKRALVILALLLARPAVAQATVIYQAPARWHDPGDAARRSAELDHRARARNGPGLSDLWSEGAAAALLQPQLALSARELFRAVSARGLRRLRLRVRRRMK
jgi:hypothetical protein